MPFVLFTYACGQHDFDVSWCSCLLKVTRRASPDCGTGTDNPSGAPEFIPGFSGVRVARSICLLCSVL